MAMMRFAVSTLAVCLILGRTSAQRPMNKRPPSPVDANRGNSPDFLGPPNKQPRQHPGYGNIPAPPGIPPQQLPSYPKVHASSAWPPRPQNPYNHPGVPTHQGAPTPPGVPRPGG
ncbi:uncharacterized protein LOC144134499 [Amblyomma americanum]